MVVGPATGLNHNLRDNYLSFNWITVLVVLGGGGRESSILTSLPVRALVAIWCPRTRPETGRDPFVLPAYALGLCWRLRRLAGHLLLFGASGGAEDNSVLSARRTSMSSSN